MHHARASQHFRPDDTGAERRHGANAGLRCTRSPKGEDHVMNQAQRGNWPWQRKREANMIRCGHQANGFPSILVPAQANQRHQTVAGGDSTVVKRRARWR